MSRMSASRRRRAPAGVSSVRTGDGTLVCARCTVAGTPARRFRGLLGREGLAVDEGLLIVPCRSVHTAFMRFAIDVVFLDGDGVVAKVVPDLRSWRSASCRRARSALELPAGRAAQAGLREGDALRFESAGEAPG